VPTKPEEETASEGDIQGREAAGEIQKRRNRLATSNPTMVSYSTNLLPDATTIIQVTVDEKVADGLQSDQEDTSEDQVETIPLPATASPHRGANLVGQSPTPALAPAAGAVPSLAPPLPPPISTIPVTVPPGVSPGLLSGLPANTPNEHTPSTTISHDSFISNLPHRSGPYANPMLPADLVAEQQPYTDNSGVSVNSQNVLHGGQGAMALAEMGPGLHEPSRRSSLYSAPTDFGQSSQTSMYHNWQPESSVPHSAPNNNPVYSYSQNQGQGTFVAQPHPMTVSQAPGYNGPFDGLPRGGFDAGHQETLFRPENVAPEPLQHGQGYHIQHHLPYQDGRLSHNPA